MRGSRRSRRAPVPTIAAVGGPAIGAGVNVALACDVIVCSPSARFDPRFLDVGIQPGGGLLWRLRERVGRQAAAALVLCGEALDGEEAAEVGLAWRCVPDDELADAALALARRAAQRPRALLARAKQTLDETASVTDGEAAVQLELEPQRAVDAGPGLPGAPGAPARRRSGVAAAPEAPFASGQDSVVAGAFWVP